MRIFEIFKFSIKGISRKWIKSMLIIFLLALSLLLLAVCILPNELILYSYKTADNALKAGVNRTGVIDVKFGSKNNEEFIDSISEIEGVDTSGSIIHGFSINIPDINKKAPAVLLGQDAWNIYDFKLSNGKYEPNDKDIDRFTMFAYLGNNYSNIPIGTTIKINQIYSVCVKGILEKDSFCHSEFLLSEDINDSQFLCLDEIVILEQNSIKDNYTNLNLFSIKPDADMNKTIAKIYEKAAAANVKVTVCTVKSVFDKELRNFRNILKIITQLLVITIFVIIIVQTCVQIVDIMENMNIYGVICANGASVMNINFIITIEAIIYFLIALGLGFSSGRFLINLLFDDADITAHLLSIYSNSILIYMIFVGLTISLISVLVPCIYISVKKPFELITKSN